MITTPILHHIYRAIQKRYPNILYYGDTSRREIAITFDDGPHPLHTPPILDTLKRHEVHATFFLLGQYVEQYPYIVKQIHDDGHQIGIHGYRHLPFPMENASTLKGQLIQSRKAIAHICNIPPETIRLIRPPFGIFTKKILSHFKEWGYQPVMWTSIPQHWMQPASWSVSQILDEVVPGVIIDLHDGHGHGTNVAQILDIAIPLLKETRYDFVTIEQMHRRLVGEISKHAQVISNETA